MAHFAELDPEKVKDAAIKSGLVIPYVMKSISESKDIEYIQNIE